MLEQVPSTTSRSIREHRQCQSETQDSHQGGQRGATYLKSFCVTFAPLQEQFIHLDEGEEETLSHIGQLVGERTFHLFPPHAPDSIIVTLQPGDALFFNHNVWHRGTPNSPDSTCMFLYLDTAGATNSKKWGFEQILDDATHHGTVAQAPGRHFVMAEAVSLLEVPALIQNAYRDPAYVTNIQGN